MTAATVVVASMALAFDGKPTAEVELNDGGVWVTKSQTLLLGHANPTAKMLDGAVLTDTDDFDVQQAGDAVILTTGADTAQAVDPATLRLGTAVDLPKDAVLRLGASTVAVLEPKKGSVWVLPADGLGSFTPNAKPTFRLGAGGDLVVGRDGTVFGLSVKRDQVVSVAVSRLGTVGTPTTRDLTQPIGEEARLTAVGRSPVVFDPESGAVQTPAAVVTVPDAAAGVLQQPSDADGAVRIATKSGLVTVPLDGGAPATTDASSQGAPIAPVWLDGCVYAAWAGSGEFLRDCRGEDDDLHSVIEGVTDETRLVFRVNRDSVMLNDTVSGSAWLVAGALQQIDNWTDVTPPDGDSDDENNSSQTTPENAPPERTEENRPPVATPDEFGVRAGRATVLPVLDNDSDPDGDVLTADLLGEQPTTGEVTPILNGIALQVKTPVDATGTSQFAYQVDDGRGGTAQAAVELRVVPETENAPPKQNRTASVVVEAGASATYNLLPDWVDPDGDDLFLRSASTASGDEVTFTPDGRVTLGAITTTSGVIEVDVVVSDGREESVGTLRFDVRAPGSTVPLTNADHVVVKRGETTTVAPLVNDAAAGIEPLRLAQVAEVEGAEILPDYKNKTFTFRSDRIGTTYVGYIASAGTASAPGLVRVDVVELGTTDLAPIAVRDVALLPSGGDVLVGVLANDVDPAGGVLVVQSVAVPEGAGVSAAVVANETVRITDHGALAQQVRVGYTISNGTQSADGEIIVIPVPAPTELRPPVAVDDETVVRAGDVATVRVLANDYSPSGSALTLLPDLVEPLPDPAAGTVFTSGDTVRFHAGSEAGTVTASYEVADEAGQRETAKVTFRVLPVDEAENQAPRPRDVTARTISGQSTVVSLPLDGIDPDGDSVELVGIGTAPQKGRISAQSETTLTYEAFDGAVGDDVFTYRVRDFLGAESTATVRVGIAPKEAVHQPPYAVKDAIIVPPGRVVAVDVTANDAAADGGPVQLLEDGLELPDIPGLKAEVVSPKLLQITVPKTPTETALTYTIADAQGLTAQAPVQIIVGEDVPLSPPVARDDRARVEDMRADGTVVVDVRANDSDVDGTVDALTVASDDPGATVTDEQAIAVKVKQQRQVIEYTVTDADGLVGRAFVFVPAVAEMRPALRANVAEVRVRTGENVRVPLADYVAAADGSTVHLTETAGISAVHANGDPLFVNGTTLSYTSAPGYVGPDAITFEVTDGTSVDDPKGRKATLSIPVTVIPKDNVPPTFTSSQITIGAGEPARTVELGPLTTDPDEGDHAALKFELAGMPGNDITAALNGSRLRLSAPKDLKQGATGVVRIRVTDGKSDPVEGVVNVTVTVTTRPLPVANDDIVGNAAAGAAVTVNVLANDVNPYPDTPLQLVGQPVVETGRGTASVQGSSVRVTPAADFTGTMVVRYRIQDASGQADRQVDGRIRLTVQGRPSAPGKPVVANVSANAVALSWSAPANNGSPIEHYTVTANGVNQDCPSTSCTVSGLSNGQGYRFRVTATNGVGTSDPSPESDVATPDERPSAPGTPTVVAGDGLADLSWSPAATTGSAIQEYTVEISPAVGGQSQRTVGGSTTSMRWPGLSNGAEYTFRVRARNATPEPSAWSGTGSGTPAGAPGAPGAPTTSRQTAADGTAQVRVAWNPPANNGAAVTEYRLAVYLGGTLVTTHTGIGATAGAFALSLNASSSNYTFTVAARNRVGWGPTSSQSSGYRQVDAPGAPADVTLTAGDSQITVAFTPGALNGASASEVGYEIQLNGGNWTTVTQGQTLSAVNGTAYRAAVRAFVLIDGTRYDGPASPLSNTVTPYGPLTAPVLFGALATDGTPAVDWTWTLPPGNGFTYTVAAEVNGIPVPASAIAAGSYRSEHDWGHNVRLEMVLTDNLGRTIMRDFQLVVPQAPAAAPSITAGWGGRVSDPANNDPYRMTIRTDNVPNGTYNITCWGTGDALVESKDTITVTGNNTLTTACLVAPGTHEYVWITLRVPGGGRLQSPDLPMP